MIKSVVCPLCEGNSFTKLFTKKNKNRSFSIQCCLNCHVIQVTPQPLQKTLQKYYDNNYFLKRSDRGYNNYFSKETKSKIMSTLLLNLQDLDFFNYEKALFNQTCLSQSVRFKKESLTSHNKNAPSTRKPHSLDIGCAAGYFVEFLHKRGWSAQGIDISTVVLPKKKWLRKLIYIDNFLKHPYKKETFDLITLWASIEHFTRPRQTLEKVFQLLRPQGRLIISTCCCGYWQRRQQTNWRYMNVPEHLFFFDTKNLNALCQTIGFDLLRSIRYGSGYTEKENMPFHYRYKKKFFDGLVKKINIGDMMLQYYEKSVQL